MKISIITPSYNSGQYLLRAIHSVLDQNFNNWEHVIVDGGSKDETLEILKKHPHLIWVSEPDEGQSDAMNKGFEMSTGDVIVYLNADDWFEEEAFSHVIESFEETKSDIVFGDLRVLFEKDGREEIRTPSTNYCSIIKYWNNSFPSNPVSYFYKRKVQKKYLFPVGNHMTMDMDFIFYATKYFSVSHIPHIFGTFLVNGENKTSKMDIGKEQKSIYLKHCLKYEKLLYLKFYMSQIIDKLKGK